uniref:TSA: Wollemia nobilis Ref_Wollemi_Transcript_15511_2082 transcribed RNA sequence n=1 Tax=Wollemia nobilis TaxID=56998 RepID=A0A0C9S654_9CONI
MCSSEMETELGKVAAFSLCDVVPPAMTGSVRCGSQMPSFSAGVSFPASSSPPQLVPAPLVVSPPRNFSYSDLQLVVTSNPPPAHARVLSNGNLGGDGDVDGDGDGEEEEKKRERDRDLQLQHLHKKRSKNWSRVETLKLIKTRAELDSRFARSGRKSELWDEIAEALQKGQFARDAQQCRDKWEKLMASFKDVRDGVKDREDNPYYDELYPLLSDKSMRKIKDRDYKDLVRQKEAADRREQVVMGVGNEEIEGNMSMFNSLDDEGDEVLEMSCSSRKRKRGAKYVSGADIGAVKALLETVISQQERFFKELLETIERNEQAREQARQEREEKWRAEERAHRHIMNNAMILLTQKVLGDRGISISQPPADGIPAAPERQCQGTKKRSKNWKRGEVLHLIKLRGEMEGRFANSTRRAVLWEELAEALDSQGIKRDGKQCREKWDKLMAAYKDVIDGKREEGDLPYFSELKSIIGGKPDDGYRFHTESDEFKDKVDCIHNMPESVSEGPLISG